MKAIFHNATEMLVAFSNEIAIGEDGWAQIAPFGDFPGMALIDDGNGGYKREKAIQRMDRKAVTQMVNEFMSSQRGVRKFLKSRPIFLGHPDMPGGGAKYPDRMPKGVFANVACRDTGFYGQPILTDDGEALVANKSVRALSGRWEADEYLGEEVIGGMKFKVFRPTRFLSAGLTDRPNLPVEMFNEAEAQQQETQMKRETVIALLASLGILNKGATFVNDASDEDVSEGLKVLADGHREQTKKATTLANEKAQLEQRVSAKDGEIATLKTEKQTAATERDTARTNFANERKARIGELLDNAIKGGRITQAERATWEPRLANEATFINEAEALKKVEAKVKTTSVTLSRGDRKVEISNANERREMVQELVREEMDRSKADYDMAFAKVQRTCPQLFEAMAKPTKG